MTKMRLRWSPTSPFARKVTVALFETGLTDRVELVPTNVFDPGTDLAADNPLGKLPVLITEGGECLYDSPVICEYLDTLHDGVRLVPPSGGERWSALRRQALGDGILDALVLALLEGRRPEAQRSQAWLDKQMGKAQKGFDAFDEEADTLGTFPTIGHITLGSAIGYALFRFPDVPWLAERPALADWWDVFSARASMEATTPKDPPKT